MNEWQKRKRTNERKNEIREEIEWMFVFCKNDSMFIQTKVILPNGIKMGAQTHIFHIHALSGTHAEMEIKDDEKEKKSSNWRQ